MLKLTRKHYNRKLLAFAASALLSIGIITTGFATWVISNSAQKDGEGQVTVGGIEDGGLTFKDIQFDLTNKPQGNAFVFDPANGDTTGDIKQSLKADALVPNTTDVYAHENLDLTFTAVLYPKSFIKNVSVDMIVPQGIKDAASKGYLVLPEYVRTDDATENKKIIIEDSGSGLKITPAYEKYVKFEDDADSQGIKITFKIELGWGTAFGYKNEEGVITPGTNPSIYLDEQINPTTSKLYTYDEKMEIITDLRRTIYSIPEYIPDVDVRKLSLTELTTKYADGSPDLGENEPYVPGDMKYTVTLYADAK